MVINSSLNCVRLTAGNWKSEIRWRPASNFFFLRYFPGLFVPLFPGQGSWRVDRKQGRERGNDMQQMATGGIEPGSAVRGQPLYMGRLLYRLSHRAPRNSPFYTAFSIQPLFAFSPPRRLFRSYGGSLGGGQFQSPLIRLRRSGPHQRWVGVCLVSQLAVSETMCLNFKKFNRITAECTFMAVLHYCLSFSDICTQCNHFLNCLWLGCDWAQATLKHKP